MLPGWDAEHARNGPGEDERDASGVSRGDEESRDCEENSGADEANAGMMSNPMVQQQMQAMQNMVQNEDMQKESRD